MANANPSKVGNTTPPKEQSDKPVIQYIGEGADKIKFEVDPKAKLIRVYSDGMILVDY